MGIRIFNNSVSAVVRSYAVAQTDKSNVIVWLELAPQHPKVLNAIWASLVNNTTEELGLRDGEDTTPVTGLHSRYLRFTSDAPRLAGRVRPKFLRLVAPNAARIEKPGEDFYTLAWPGMTVGTALTAMLEAGTACPIRISWGDYLLAEAARSGYATPLLTGGPVPCGYAVDGGAPWAEIIREGVQRGRLSLDGGATAVSTAEFEKAKTAALAKAGVRASHTGRSESESAEEELAYADH